MGINLPYFEESAYENLLNSITRNEGKYNGKYEWLDEYFIGEKYIATSTLEVPDITLETSDRKLSVEELNAQDFQNVMLVHSAYSGVITPQIATNKYMWTALAHTTFSDYVYKRWGTQDIQKRFFCSGGRQSLIYYNAISRLWWIGELTYDEKHKYKYTKILLESGQQTLKDLTDCAYSTNRKISRGIIRAIADLKETGAVYNFGDCFRDLNKFLNRRGAISSLDYLEEDEIKTLALDYMKKWQAKYTKTST